MSSGFPVVFNRFYKNCNFNLSEFSTIDTTILVLGALFAGNYFGGEVENLALQLRDATQWSDAIKLVEIQRFQFIFTLVFRSESNPTIYPTINPNTGAPGGNIR